MHSCMVRERKRERETEGTEIKIDSLIMREREERNIDVSPMMYLVPAIQVVKALRDGRGEHG